MYQKHYIISFLIVSFLAVISNGCGKERNNASSEAAKAGILVSIGDSVLTIDRVLRRIPAGLSEADSAALFNAIVERWVSDRLASDVAVNNIPDPEGIEKMVRRYRTSLVLDRYRRMMVAETSKLPEEDSLKRYYEIYKEGMTTERPIVKGMLMRVDVKTPELERIRKWMSSGKKEDIKRLESYSLAEDADFDNFEDIWMDFGEIAEQIPKRFSHIDEFLAGTRDFEVADGNMIYILHIRDVIPSGNIMPYEFARPRIMEILMHDSHNLSEKRLYRSLLEKGLKQGSVKAGEYDPSALFK